MYKESKYLLFGGLCMYKESKYLLFGGLCMYKESKYLLFGGLCMYKESKYLIIFHPEITPGLIFLELGAQLRDIGPKNKNCQV